MLKKLCVLVVGLGLCIGLTGCTGNKPAELPKEEIKMPEGKPSTGTMQMEAPE